MSFLQKPHNIGLYRLLCDLCGNMKFGSHITMPSFMFISPLSVRFLCGKLRFVRENNYN